MTPMTVNAYANPGMIEIVFPAAILQPPFFDPNADDAVNYGGIGAVIGHELSHHFDDQGAQVRQDRQARRLVDRRDIDGFKTLLASSGAQYDAYEPLPGMHVNGELTLGENIADLAGLNVALRRLQDFAGRQARAGDRRLHRRPALLPRLGAGVARKYREPNLRQRLMTDPHTPGVARRVVRNLDAWYAAFDVKPGQKLYLAPDDRVRIW